MLVSAERFKVDVPHEPGEWVEYIKPSWRAIKRSKRAQESEGRSDLKELGGDMMSALMAAAKEGGEEAVQTVIRAQDADVSAFDLGSLFGYCIKGWSYAHGKPTAQQIDDLDQKTALWLGEVLIKSVAQLTEEEEKNS